VPEIGFPISGPDVDMGARTETLPTQLEDDEDMDCDAEDETDNKMTEGMLCFIYFILQLSTLTLCSHRLSWPIVLAR
jgi:hypothetical protein